MLITTQTQLTPLLTQPCLQSNTVPCLCAAASLDVYTVSTTIWTDIKFKPCCNYNLTFGQCVPACLTVYKLPYSLKTHLTAIRTYVPLCLLKKTKVTFRLQECLGWVSFPLQQNLDEKTPPSSHKQQVKYYNKIEVEPMMWQPWWCSIKIFTKHT